MLKFSINRRCGFTLVEAVLAVLIAGGLLAWVFAYMTDSIRGIGHNEDTLATIKEIQRLTTRLRHDLYHVRPWHYPKWDYGDQTQAPVDLYKTRRTGPDRVYHPILYRVENASRDSLVPIENPTLKTWTYDNVAGVRQYRPRETLWDSHFRHFFAREDKVLENFHYLGPLEDALVCYDREIKEPFSAKVHECYLGVEGEKRLYRFYKEDRNGDPLHYVGLYLFDGKGNEQEIALFGHIPEQEGRIRGFSIVPRFEFSQDYQKLGQPPHMAFLRFFAEVHIVFRGKRQGFGPEGRKFEVSFSVMNPYLNSAPYGEGNFSD